MLTLLSEVHFWNTCDEINIKSNDYGAHRYYDRKNVSDVSTHTESKKSYTEKRGMIWSPANTRMNKLKDRLRELEDHVIQYRIVYSKWLNSSTLRCMFSNGAIVNVFVDIHSGDISRISFDKYLLGKLQSEFICDVLLTRTNFLCTYNDNQITVIHFTKPTLKHIVAEKIGNLEPKLLVLELAGPSGRRLERKMSPNITEDMIVVWWRFTGDEVYPWSPSVRDHDRANVHVYRITGLKMELICFRRTEFDPLSVAFSSGFENQLYCIEQKVSPKGEVTVEMSTYEVSRGNMLRLSVVSIPLQTQVCCHSLSGDDRKLLLGCIDGTVALFDQNRGVTHVIKAAFIPTIVGWHVDSVLVVVANERCQLQLFDVSLACVKIQLFSEDITPLSILDLAIYFKNQPTLSDLQWNNKSEAAHYGGKYVPGDGLLFLNFERGPLAMLKIVGAGGCEGDVSNSGLTADVLAHQYLSLGQVDSAINLLLSLDWNIEGTVCLISLQRIVNYILKQPLTSVKEAQLQTALGSFHQPPYPISHTTEQTYGDQVRDLTRKFFHQLVRYQSFEKAFLLAIDLGNHDLFMDLHHYAIVLQDNEMARAAKSKALELISRPNSTDEHSTCSRSSCSECTDSESTDADNSFALQTQYTPPLPSVKAPNKLTVKSVPYSETYKFTPPTPQLTQNLGRCGSHLNLYTSKNEFCNNLFANAPLSLARKPSMPDLTFTNSPLTKKPSLPEFPVQRQITQPLLYHQTRTIVHKTVSMNIPPPPTLSINTTKQIRPAVTKTVSSGAVSKPPGEKNKVKFSDTVTAFIVPEVPRSEKPPQVRKPNSVYFTDPKRELADSLPLCHPNEDYLKDFTPISSRNESDDESRTKIKVVHFGVV